MGTAIIGLVVRLSAAYGRASPFPGLAKWASRGKKRESEGGLGQL